MLQAVATAGLVCIGYSMLSKERKKQVHDAADRVGRWGNSNVVLPAVKLAQEKYPTSAGGYVLKKSEAHHKQRPG